MQVRSEWARQVRFSRGEGVIYIRAAGAVTALDDALARVRALEDDGE